MGRRTPRSGSAARSIRARRWTEAFPGWARPIRRRPVGCDTGRTRQPLGARARVASSGSSQLKGDRLCVFLGSFLRHRWHSSSRADPIAIRAACPVRLRARSRSTPGPVMLQSGSLRSWTGPVRSAPTAAARATTIASVPLSNAWLLVREAPRRSPVPREPRQSASAWPAESLEGAASTPRCARSAATQWPIVILPCPFAPMVCARSEAVADSPHRSSGTRITTPPRTSPTLKSFRGLSGWVLWQVAQASTTALSG
jgi:hypothetical protein